MSQQMSDTRAGYQWRRQTVAWLAGAAAFGGLTGLCLWSGLDFAAAAGAYLALVLLAAAWGGEGVSVVGAVGAALCLGTGFVAGNPPFVSEGAWGRVAGFLAVALLVAIVVGRIRRRAEAADAAREALQAAYRDNEQRLRDYAETASDWIWESGPDHRFTRISDQLTVIDVEPGPAVGHRRWELAVCVETEPEKWHAHRALLDAHLPFRGFTYMIMNKDGSARHVSVSGKPVFDDRGRFTGYRGVGTDVTAAVRAEQAEKALQQAQAELSHVTRVTTLGGLAASIAHELNQPLSAIVANGEAALRWLSHPTADGREVRSAVERIIADAHRAGAVIRRTREMSRRGKPETQSLDINSLIEEALSLVRREAISHRVTLRLEAAPDLPSVRGDRVQLQQIVINLVLNAIEAMASVSGRKREVVIRSHRHDRDQVVVAVQDYGIGIDPAHVETVFNAFFTTKPSGLGMGLSICRSIIEAHGGRVWASRNAGPGTTFHFTLRAAGAVASAEQNGVRGSIAPR